MKPRIQESSLPVDLVRLCLFHAKKTHEMLSPGVLPRLIATKRNAVATAMLPEASVAVRAALASFKIRIFLWILVGASIPLSALLSWWFLCLTAIAAALERVLAARERGSWILVSAMLLSAEMLASDFAGWGTRYPIGRQYARQALGSDSDNAPALEWLDYYLPHRSELSADLLRALGPRGEFESGAHI